MILTNEQAMLNFGRQLMQVSQATYPTIFLQGQLGAGKTTLTRGMLRALAYQGVVKSPTYTLVEHYAFPTIDVYHFDLYRLSDAQELEHIGMRDYFKEHTLCIIEWPEYGEGYLPIADIICEIKILDHQRELLLLANTDKGNNIVKQISRANDD
ncbi:MAG: tRNA (adenosine(37)-N6)-threonylcarbamoyltransferase complex ATPase subunit type 1 TsaE [Gammaproteobacteria bacterium]|nr:tRNA (adenosine(37)-N6)-threonylcarbamoyltransferase complex ATPase subunit type 1 TsaE [Gammaproteobacteria bacterium]